MLSDEEKKAIERLIIYKDKIKDELYPTIDFEEEKAIGVVLNLIEKQQKELEKLKENNGYHIGFIDGGIAKRYEYEDKIKAKKQDNM